MQVPELDDSLQVALESLSLIIRLWTYELYLHAVVLICIILISDFNKVISFRKLNNEKCNNLSGV